MEIERKQRRYRIKSIALVKLASAGDAPNSEGGWSGRRESNPRRELGKLLLYH
jgi:hypothetical protein